MNVFINKKIKLALITAVVAMTLTGCGSSSQEDQLNWIVKWKNNYEQNMKMLSVCFKEAGVRSMTQQLSKQQNKVINECEISYITEAAEDEGVSLDSETIQNNIIQL